MGFRVGAGLVVAVHLVFVAFLLAGGFVAWRRPGVLKLHAPAVAASAALAAGGFDCPLTVLEKWLRTQAGVAVYRKGFVSHYLVEPLYSPGVTPALDVALAVLTAGVIAIAYGRLLVHRVREDRVALRRSYVS